MSENNFISNKIKKYIIFSSLGCAPLVFFGIALFVTLFLLLGLFKENTSSDKIVSSDTVYSECKGITVDGKLYSLEKYVAGVITAENAEAGKESMKAQAVAARTYAIVKTKNCTVAIRNDSTAQNFNPDYTDNAMKASTATAGQVLTYNGKLFLSEYDSFYRGNDFSCDSSTCSVTYTRLPSNKTHKVSVPASYRDRLIGGHGRGMSQVAANYMDEQGKTYKEILKYFYADGVVLSNLTSEKGPSGASGATFTSSKGKKYVNFSQFFKLNNGSTATGACYITSIAIIAHANDSSVTPLKVWNYNGGNFVQNATVTHFLKNIVFFDNSPVRAKKQLIIKNLSNGGAAIFLFGYNACTYANGASWTNGTHFVAVLDYNKANDSVYVSNPSAQGDKKRSGWIPLDNLGCAALRVLTSK